MSIVQLKIKKDKSVIEYIKIIRQFDHTLSMGTIKKAIDNDDFVISRDLYEYDVLESLQGIDRNRLFRKMIAKLRQKGAKVAVYVNSKRSSLKTLDNDLEMMDEIAEEVEHQMDEEALAEENSD